VRLDGDWTASAALGQEARQASRAMMGFVRGLAAAALLTQTAAFETDPQRDLLFAAGPEKTPYSGHCKDYPSVFFKKYGQVTCKYARALKQAKGRDPCNAKGFSAKCKETCGLCTPSDDSYPDIYDDPDMYNDSPPPASPSPPPPAPPPPAPPQLPPLTECEALALMTNVRDSNEWCDAGGRSDSKSACENGFFAQWVKQFGQQAGRNVYAYCVYDEDSGTCGQGPQNDYVC